MPDHTTQSPVDSSQAMLELTLLNAEVGDARFDDVVVEAISRGIPPEILTRLRDLWEATKLVGDELIQIGKIIVLKIIDFLKAHPKLVASLALGAAVYFLTQAIPFVGPLLAPLLATVTTVATLGKAASFDDLVDMAKDFFSMLVSIFNAVAARWAIA